MTCRRCTSFKYMLSMYSMVLLNHSTKPSDCGCYGDVRIFNNKQSSLISADSKFPPISVDVSGVVYCSILRTLYGSDTLLVLGAVFVVCHMCRDAVRNKRQS